MRIEYLPQVLRPTQSPPIFTTPKVGWPSTDSIRCGECSSTFWKVFLAIKRKVSNFFRAILSFCLPVKPRAPVQVQEIEYKKSKIPEIEYKKSKIEKTGEFYRYRVLVNGVETRNEIIFQKQHNFLNIYQLIFPDQEMREHIGAILKHMLKEEKMEFLVTKHLKKAQEFWNAGFTTQSKIRFHHDGSDFISRLITNTICEAKKKRESLNEHYNEAINRIDEKSKPSLAGSIMSSFMDLGPTEIALSDLLLLLEVVEGDDLGGVCFGANNIVIFKEASETK